MASLRIASCQLNLHVGDLSLNKEKILRAYKEALAADADIAVFSELAVCGYPPEDLLLKSGFVQDFQMILGPVSGDDGDIFGRFLKVFRTNPEHFLIKI